MSVLMGANVANEVAKGDFAEATIGCTDLAIGKKWCALFNTKDFKVDAVQDVAGAELCGALKNVVALGAGFSDVSAALGVWAKICTASHIARAWPSAAV